MKKIIYSIATLVLAGAIIVACDKEQKPATENGTVTIDGTEENMFMNKSQSSTIEVINGRLKFDTMEEFEATVNELMNESDAYLTQWEAGLQGFTSMVTVESHFVNSNNNIPPQYADLIDLYERPDGDEAGSCTIERPVTDKCLATILNEKGIVQIGTTVYQFDRDKWRRIIDATETEVEEIHGHQSSA